MNGEQIKEYGKELIDDDFGSNEDVIMNAAYHEVLAVRPWHWLLKWDESQTLDGNYQIDIPTDFGNTWPDDEDGRGYLYYGDEYSKYYQVSKENKHKYKDISGFFYVDHALDKIVFTGLPPTGKTVRLPYQYIPADITDATSPVTGFKAAYHPLIAHKMAMIFYITEQEEKNRSYRPENAAEYTRLLNLMELDEARTLELMRDR